MAFTTVNVTPSMGEWDIVDGYGTDISASSELLADLTSNKYLVKSISFEMEDTDRWFKVLDDAVVVCGPVDTKGRQWKIRYESPLLIAGALNVQTENDTICHIIVCFRKLPII